MQNVQERSNVKSMNAMLIINVEREIGRAATMSKLGGETTAATRLRRDAQHRTWPAQGPNALNLCGPSFYAIHQQIRYYCYITQVYPQVSSTSNDLYDSTTSK